MPGVESLLTFHVYVKIPELSVVPLKFILVVLVESVTVPFTFAPTIVKFEFAASRTVVLRVSLLHALMGFFERSSEINSSFELLLGDDTRCELGAIIAGLLLDTPVTFTLLWDVRLELSPQESFAVILLCPSLITVGVSL